MEHFGGKALRQNPLKPCLAAGGCAFGTMTFEFFTPGYPTICREAGAEFILYDMEHSGVGFETMKAQFAFCRGLDLVPLVRVPSGDDYSDGPETDKIAQANARTMVIALVETAKGIENVDAIAAVDGVDVVWLGHYDLTNFIGIPGEFDNPKFHAAVDSLVMACKKHGKTPGFLAGNEQWARDFRAKGFRMIAYGVDTLLMQGALAHGIKLLQGTVTS